MPYDFELVFTGLFVLTFRGKDKQHPDEVEVGLVQSAGHPHGHDHGRGGALTEHRPLLSYLQETISEASEHKDQVLPAPNGRLIAFRELAGERITISPPPEGPSRIVASWRPAAAPGEAAPRVPGDESEEIYLDWVPTLREVVPDAPAPTNGPLSGLSATHVTGRIRLLGGDLFAAEVVRDLDNEYVLWSFEAGGGPAGGMEPHAIADMIVLRMEGLEGPVDILGHSAGRLALRPSRRPGRGDRGDVVRASVTNLPPVDAELSETLDHFESLLDFASAVEPNPTIMIPKAEDGLLDCSSSTICPGVTHGGTG